jgi:hypothetical protein
MPIDRVHGPAVYRLMGSLNQSHPLYDLRPNSNSTLPTRSRRQGDSDLLTYVVENSPRVAGDDSAAQLTSGNGEGALRWSSGSGNGFSSDGGDRWSSSE